MSVSTGPSAFTRHVADCPDSRPSVVPEKKYTNSSVWYGDSTNKLEGPSLFCPVLQRLGMLQPGLGMMQKVNLKSSYYF